VKGFIPLLTEEYLKVDAKLVGFATIFSDTKSINQPLTHSKYQSIWKVYRGAIFQPRLRVATAADDNDDEDGDDETSLTHYITIDEVEEVKAYKKLCPFLGHSVCVM